MNLFFTLLRRRGVLFGLMAVLLAAVIAFETIAVAALLNVSAQITAVSDRYTTIAVPKGTDYWQRILYSEAEGRNLPLLQQKMQYPGLLSEDRRGTLGALVTGCESVSAYEKGFYGNDAFEAFGHSLVVLTARCTSVNEYLFDANRTTWDEAHNPTGSEVYQMRNYTAEFSPQEIVCASPAYGDSLPEIRTISTADLCNADGTLPFEEGKTYLLFGSLSALQSDYADYFDPEATPGFVNEGQYFLHLFYSVNESGSVEPWNRKIFDFLRPMEEAEGEDGVWYYRASDGTLPFYVEYDGSVEDFLSSDEGTLWRETILPFCRQNYDRADLILTDNLDSILWFNTGEASVLEGRSFEPSDYANGENVCLVSAAYALKNGLFVGSSIELDLYESQFSKMYVLKSDPTAASMVECNVFAPLREENRLNLKKNYTIVGIYTAPEFSPSCHAFSANTIFLPKASIPNAERYENIEFELLYSLILENGKAGEFEAALAERGCGNLFAYFDQDYNVLAETLDVMHGNALRMVLIGGALFVLAAALFFFLFLRQTADAARKLRLLGIRGGLVRKQRYAAAVVLIVLAAALGAAGSIVLYSTVTQQVLSASIALEPPVLLLCAAAQTLLLLLTALACTLTTARQNLMQKK